MKRKVFALSILSIGLTLSAFAYNQASTTTACQQNSTCCEKATCCRKSNKPSCCDGNKPADTQAQTSRP